MSMIYHGHVISLGRVGVFSTIKYLDWKVQKNPKGPLPISCRSRGLNILHESAVAPDNPMPGRLIPQKGRLVKFSSRPPNTECVLRDHLARSGEGMISNTLYCLEHVAVVMEVVGIGIGMSVAMEMIIVTKMGEW